MDDRFYIIVVSGSCAVERHGQAARVARHGRLLRRGQLRARAPSAPRRSARRARSRCCKVSSTLLEQVSASCQLRFNRVFLRTLISRLQSPN